MARARAQVKARPRPRYDPLAPIAPPQLRRNVTQDVRAQTIPLARELTRQINAAAAAGAANIAGVSNQLATTLGSQAGAQREIYDRARANLGAIDTQQAGALGTAGGAIAGDLAGRLASSGATPALADSLKVQMGGAVGAAYGKGTAQQAQLTTDQAGAESYASKLPGLAQLAGLQGISDRRAQAQRDIATGIGDLNARVPGLIASELDNARNLEYQKGVARLGFAGDIAKQNADYAKTQAQIDAANYRARLSSSDRRASISAANARSGKSLAERARHNGITEREQATRDQASASIRRQSNKERARHNRASEKSKSKTTGPYAVK